MTTYTDGGTTTTKPAVGQPIPATAANPPGVKTSYSSKCVDGRVELIETAWITFNSPAGSRPTTQGYQELICEVTIVSTHTIKTDEICPKPGQKKGEAPYGAIDSKTQFGYGLNAIKEAEEKEKEKEKEKSKDK